MALDEDFGSPRFPLVEGEVVRKKLEEVVREAVDAAKLHGFINLSVQLQQPADFIRFTFAEVIDPAGLAVLCSECGDALTNAPETQSMFCGECDREVSGG